MRIKKAPARPTAAVAASKLAAPIATRSPEPLTVQKARNAVNAAANDFEVARQAYAAAGDRLHTAQVELARAMAAPK